jgi:hypothetical protein
MNDTVDELVSAAEEVGEFSMSFFFLMLMALRIKDLQ